MAATITHWKMDVNPTALYRYHSLAARWERCRSAWFEQKGKFKTAQRLSHKAVDHTKAAGLAKNDIGKRSRLC